MLTGVISREPVLLKSTFETVSFAILFSEILHALDTCYLQIFPNVAFDGSAQRVSSWLIFHNTPQGSWVVVVPTHHIPPLLFEVVFDITLLNKNLSL